VLALVGQVRAGVGASVPPGDRRTDVRILDLFHCCQRNQVREAPEPTGHERQARLRFSAGAPSVRVRCDLRRLALIRVLLVLLQP
jgi:hypothetical protein